PGRRRQQTADADLGAAVDVVAAIGEEEAEAELADLLPVEMLAQAQHLGEVVRADLDRGFADLERGLRRRMAAPLEDGDRQRRIRLAQLQGESEPGQSTPQDRHVDTLHLVHQPWPPLACSSGVRASAAG